MTWKFIRTNIEDGSDQPACGVFFGVDGTKKYDDVVAALNKVRDQLPGNVTAIKTLKPEPWTSACCSWPWCPIRPTTASLNVVAEALENS